MTASNFAQSIALVLVSEGGFVDNPADPGGATNLGITIATLRRYRGKPVSVADVRALKRDEAEAIYHNDYWATIAADQLPPGVDYAAFDVSVNSGPGKAAQLLQECLSVIVDGHVGPLTLKAAYQVRAADLVVALCVKRLAYLRSLPTWSKFGAGWAARVARVQADALKMAANPIPQPVTATTIHQSPGMEPPKPAPLPPRPPAPTQPRPASSGFFDALAKLFAAIIAAIFPKGT